MTTLTAHLVKDTLHYCCFEEDELEENFKILENSINAVGYQYFGIFNPERLKEKTPLICEMIDDLLESFRTFQGDVFLNVGRTKEGERWTNSIHDLDALVTLGLATKKIHWTHPREMWFIFPAEMPFLRTKDVGFVPDPNYKDMSKYREGRESSHLVQTWLKRYKASVMADLIEEGTKEEDIISNLLRTFLLQDQAEIAEAVTHHMVLWLESKQGRSFVRDAYQLDAIPPLIKIAPLSEYVKQTLSEWVGSPSSATIDTMVQQAWQAEAQNVMTDIIYRKGGDREVSNITWCKVNYGAQDTAEIVVDTFIGWLNSHAGRCFIRHAFELDIPTHDSGGLLPS